MPFIWPANYQFCIYALFSVFSLNLLFMEFCSVDKEIALYIQVAGVWTPVIPLIQWNFLTTRLLDKKNSINNKFRKKTLNKANINWSRSKELIYDWFRFLNQKTPIIMIDYMDTYIGTSANTFWVLKFIFSW
jgi:hypothetical protein